MSDIEDLRRRYGQQPAQQPQQPAPTQAQPSAQQPQPTQAAQQGRPVVTGTAAGTSDMYRGVTRASTEPDTETSTSVEIAGARREVSENGWRGVFNRILGTNLGRSDAEIEMDRWRSQVNSTIRHPKVIGVVSPNGGVGKSSSLQLIGSSLSSLRSGTGAVGIDIDASSSILVYRMKPNTATRNKESVATFVRDPNVTTRTDVDAYLTTNSEGFSVLPGVGETGDDPIQADGLVTAVHRLSDYYPLILLDFPGSAREVPVAQEALKWLDGMVFVIETTANSISSAKHFLKQIANVRPDLFANTIVLLNHRTREKDLVDLAAQRSDILRIMQLGSDGPVFEVGFDPHVAESSAMSLPLTETATQRQFAKFSAELMKVLPLGDHPEVERHYPKRPRA